MVKVSACLSFAVVLCLSSIFVSSITGDDKGGAAKERLFEMRTYTAAPGKLDELHARFRNHTNKLFQKHGMTLIGYWTHAEGDGAKNTLVYILAYPDKEAREKAWKAFQDDPEWKKAKADSEANGTLLAKPPESVLLKPTDYSPIK